MVTEELHQRNPIPNFKKLVSSLTEWDLYFNLRIIGINFAILHSVMLSTF